MNITNIEWCDYTINPIVGCSKCSPGCEHCYAEKFAARLAKNPATAAKYDGVVGESGKWTGKISALDMSCLDRLSKKPGRVFVGSMTDIFHENTPYNRIDDLFIKIAQFPQHTFLFLTKRPHIMASYFSSDDSEYWLTWGKTVEEQQHLAWPQKNVWLGVTVCNQQEADEKIPILLQIPAAKRFVSVEPMLGPVDLFRHLDMEEPLLHWIICGGETGTKARPLHPDWIRELRDQCRETSTPFFFKSWGEWLPCSQMPDDFDCSKYFDGDIGDDGIFISPPALEIPLRNMVCSEQTFRVGKKLSGHLIDGEEYREFPEG